MITLFKGGLINPHIFKICWLVISLPFFLSRPLFAACLSDLFGALAEQGDFLLEQNFDYFALTEEGIHGSAIYEDFDSEPAYSLFDTRLTFPLFESSDCTLGLIQAIPTEYSRFTYKPDKSLGVVQDYRINRLSDYLLNFRFRHEPAEVYMTLLEKTQKDNWRSAVPPADPNYFSFIRSHYEDFKAGIRYMPNSSQGKQDSSLSRLTRPLLGQRQMLIGSELGFKKGKVRRNSFTYTASETTANFYHSLQDHFIPRFDLVCGLRDNLQMETGIAYTTPLKYRFEFREYKSAGTVLLEGDYKLDSNFEVPLKFLYRPEDNLELTVSSDLAFTKQRLDYWGRASDGSITTYPSRKLSYFNARPSLGIRYLNGKDRPIQSDRFSRLTKELLNRGEFLIELDYLRDLTSLDKDADCGPQNIIDPYKLFMYPMDYFVAGSELSSFFTGNTSNSAAETRLQNYDVYQLTFTYGVTDRFNTGLKAGYHSGSHLHQYTIGNPKYGYPSSSIYDLKTRFYVFKPYYFFDLFSDWRIKQNCLVSFGCYFVPEYTTLLELEGLPEGFKVKNSYGNLSLDVKILF